MLGKKGQGVSKLPGFVFSMGIVFLVLESLGFLGSETYKIADPVSGEIIEEPVSFLQDFKDLLLIFGLVFAVIFLGIGVNQNNLIAV